MTSLKVLLVEDSEDDAALVKRQLEAAGYAVTLGRVDTEPALKEALRREQWDVVFSDFSMPRFDGVEALRVVRAHDPDIPFIVVSGTIGEEHAVELMKQGAQDYLLKGNVTRLIPAVERELRDAKVRREHRLAHERIRRLAYYDSLTQLPNRQHLVDDLLRLAAHPRPLALALVNLIGFREINETLGYAKGDQVICAVAARLQEHLAASDLYHLHGGEFAVLVQSHDRSHIDALIQNLNRWLGPPHVSGGFRIRVAARIGVATAEGARAASLLQRASMAVTFARGDGKTLAWYDEARDPSNPQSFDLVSDLHDALGTDQLYLVFQPKVQCATGTITGCEALLRWRHPAKGLIGPDVFIPMAEKSGLVDDIAAHVVARVLERIAYWRKHGPILPVAINLSPKNLLNDQLMDDILQAGAGGRSDTPRIEVELTETALMRDPDESIAILARLHGAGINLYIDDFGTGFSSLAYLAQLPIHAIKIDKSFVLDVANKREADTIVRSTISLAHNLGLRVVAEGVENGDIWNRLMYYGCDEAQGYHFSKPLPPEEFEPLARAWSPSR